MGGGRVPSNPGPLFSPEHRIRDRDLRAEWWARAPAIRDRVYDAPAMPSSLLQVASHQSKAKDRSLADFQSRLALTTRTIDALFHSVAGFVENNRDVFPDTLCHYWLQLYRDITLQMRDHLTTMSESRLGEIRQASQYGASLRYITPEHTLIPEEMASEFTKERRATSKSKAKTRKQRTSYRNSRKHNGIRSRSRRKASTIRGLLEGNHEKTVGTYVTFTEGAMMGYYRPAKQWKSPSPLNLSKEQEQAIAREVEELLEKKAIEKVRRKNVGFVSRLFTILKESGGLRPFLDLRELNKFIPPMHLETLAHLLPLINRGAYMTSVDLSDA
ncbi:uncharacterized protein VTP21DRAFT_4769 [Calcarisporiella thermophila]|uniref:uncharacterized protein n=1 Tax=Calcarisporiella thermophila TaxID=911321 RepID=UPI0037447647